MIALSELGRYSIVLHFWQQILRYHNRAVQIPNSRLCKLALLDDFVEFRGSTPRIEDMTSNWRSGVYICTYVVMLTAMQVKQPLYAL